MRFAATNAIQELGNNEHVARTASKKTKLRCSSARQKQGAEQPKAACYCYTRSRTFLIKFPQPFTKASFPLPGGATSRFPRPPAHWWCAASSPPGCSGRRRAGRAGACCCSSGSSTTRVCGRGCGRRAAHGVPWFDVAAGFHTRAPPGVACAKDLRGPTRGIGYFEGRGLGARRDQHMSQVYSAPCLEQGNKHETKKMHRCAVLMTVKHGKGESAAATKRHRCVTCNAHGASPTAKNLRRAGRASAKARHKDFSTAPRNHACPSLLPPSAAALGLHLRPLGRGQKVLGIIPP